MMRYKRMIGTLALAAGLGLTFTFSEQVSAATAPATQPAQADSADALYKQYQAVALPQFDRSKAQDTAYRQKFIEAYRAAAKQRAEIAKTFYEKYPNDPRVGKMLVQRWRTYLGEGKPGVVLKETTAFLKAHPKSDERADALYYRFGGLLYQQQVSEKALEKTADKFLKAAPTDPRGAMMLSAVASRATDKDTKVATYNRIVKNYPHTQVARMATLHMKQIKMIGKPFELSFDDAVTGKHYDTADMKGKVLVIDFWATWCAPCVAAMPEMKQRYKTYHPKGVNFIGVSLDQPKAQGGLKALRRFVKEKNVPWPQYYQGKGWQNSVAATWDVRAIPQVFVIDANGDLYSVDGRGRLDTILPKLLSKEQS